MSFFLLEIPSNSNCIETSRKKLALRDFGIKISPQSHNRASTNYQKKKKKNFTKRSSCSLLCDSSSKTGFAHDFTHLESFLGRSSAPNQSNSGNKNKSIAQRTKDFCGCARNSSSLLLHSLPSSSSGITPRSISSSQISESTHNRPVVPPGHPLPLIGGEPLPLLRLLSLLLDSTFLYFLCG